MTHERTIEDIVESNLNMSIDQAGEYGGLKGAFDSFNQNTIDSVMEDGYSWADALGASNLFSQGFSGKTGIER